MSRIVLRACLVLLLATAASVAQVTVRPFIDPATVDFTTILPVPPADDSPAGRADLETVLQLQRERTEAHRRRIEAVAHQSIFTFARPVLGDWFTEENLPLTTLFFHQITEESYAITRLAKAHFARARPYERDPSVEAYPRRSRSKSYPSGHAGDAATWVVILEVLFPEHEGAFEDALREAMWCRVLGGSHYPSDTQAGAILGKAIGEQMLQSEAMLEALAMMRTEVEAVRSAAASPPP